MWSDSILEEHSLRNALSLETRSVFAKGGDGVDYKRAAGERCLSDGNVVFVTLVVGTFVKNHRSVRLIPPPECRGNPR